MNKLNLAPDSFGFDIAYRNVVSRSIKMHCHDFHEMVYVSSGIGKHVTEQGIYDIGPGDLLIIPPEHGHAYEDRSHMEVVNIMFDLNRLPYPAEQLKDDPYFQAFFSLGDIVSDDFRIRNKLTLTGDDRRQVESIIHEMLTEYNQQRRARKTRLIGLLSELFVAIIRFCGTERYASSRDLLLMRNILQYIAEHCARMPSIPELAKKFALSQKSLERLFLESVQMTPLSYILDQRLKTAAEKLCSGNRTISETAFECGFPDSNYFTKLFRKKYGVSPRLYRKKSA